MNCVEAKFLVLDLRCALDALNRTLPLGLRALERRRQLHLLRLLLAVRSLRLALTLG